MKEAIGGIFSIQAIVIFLVLVCGLLAFSVSYTKAFKVKNDIRRVIEEFEGLTESASKKIDNVADKYTYNVSDVNTYVNICNNMPDYKAYRSTTNNGNNVVFCVKCELVNREGTDEGKLIYKGAVYTIATFVTIDIPIINRMFPKAASFLRVEGETALIYSSGNNSEVCKYAKTS